MILGTEKAVDAERVRAATVAERKYKDMANHTGTCPNCRATVQVDAALLIKASRLACSWCGYVEDMAAFELSQPNISPNEQAFWSVLFLGAVGFGIYKLGQYIEQSV
jgi:ribosomal protein S27AE